jgi:hypothetical protein
MASRRAFEQYFFEYYANSVETTFINANPAAQSTSALNPMFSLFTRGRQEVLAPRAELERFFALSAEPYNSCPDPVQWWGSRRATFPCLSRMARDILSIPGM